MSALATLFLIQRQRGIIARLSVGRALAAKRLGFNFGVRHVRDHARREKPRRRENTTDVRGSSNNIENLR